MSTLVLVNRRARRIAREPSLTAALSHLPARVVFTSDLADLDACVEAHPATRVVIVGGDGSHLAALSSLARRGALPEVALVAAGTVGTAARAMGSRGRVVEEARAALCSKSVVTAPTISVELDDGRALVGFTFGAGLVSGFFEEYDASPRGLPAAAGLALKIALGAPLGRPTAGRVLARVQARVEADGRALPGDAYSLIVASALRDVGLGVKVTYRARERLDRVHAVASTASPSALALASPRALLGRSLGSAAALDALLARLDVTFPRATRVIVDGDSFSTTRATVRPGPPIKRVACG